MKRPPSEPWGERAKWLDALITHPGFFTASGCLRADLWDPHERLWISAAEDKRREGACRGYWSTDRRREIIMARRRASKESREERRARWRGYKARQRDRSSEGVAVTVDARSAS